MPKFDIILYGATGFTGQLCSIYLNSIASSTNTKFALAGRSQSKLNELKVKLGNEKIETLIADSDDMESLRELVKQTKVVISVVGPYLLYGAKLVAACAEFGIHYVDLTGESPFIHKMMTKHEQQAKETKAIIVHSCGFDSIPSDLTVFLAVQRLAKVATVGQVTSFFAMKGGASGGTLASMFAMLEGSQADFAIQQDPFSLSPVPANHKPKIVFVSSATFRNKTLVGSFFFMAPHNSAIVRRTWGLLTTTPGSGYPDSFEYEELMASPNYVFAALTSLITYAAFISLALFSPVRYLLARFGPSPGEGPTVEQQQSGYFKTTTIATSVDKQNSVEVVMKGNLDPGYAGTARLLVESAMCLVHNFDELTPLAKQGGFLTPATAFGETLANRLEGTGTFSFALSSDKKE